MISLSLVTIGRVCDEIWSKAAGGKVREARGPPWCEAVCVTCVVGRFCGGGDCGRRSVWKHTTVHVCTLSRRLVLGT